MAATMWEKSNRRFSSDSHRLSREDLADELDSDSLDIKPPQAKIPTNYATHRDAGSYRRDTSRHNSTHYKGVYREKERESDKHRERDRERERERERDRDRERERERERDREHLEHKRDSGNWRYERTTKVESREQTQHHYHKYHEESYHHHHTRQSHSHYYNQHDNYERTRHSNEEFYNARNSTDALQASTSRSSKSRQHLDEAYDIESEKAETLRVERRKRHKTHTHVAELADDQTEHDLRSRLLSKRNKFMKGHDAVLEEPLTKEAKLSYRNEVKPNLTDDHHILELKRERLMLRNLLKNTFSNSSEKEVEKTSERSTKRNSVRKSSNVLSPAAVAASVTAGLKDLTGLKSKKISTYAIESETEHELDLVTDESEATNSKHSEEEDSTAASNEHNILNSSSSSKTKKLKKKKKKKKKKRHHTESDAEVLPDDAAVIVSDSTDSEHEHYQKKNKNMRESSATAVSISTDKSSSASTNSTNSAERRTRKKHFARDSSIPTVSDVSKSDSLPSSRASSHSRSHSRTRSRSRSRSYTRSREASRRRSYSRSISTDSERSGSSHSPREKRDKSKSIEREVKLEKSNNVGNEVILDKEDCNLPNYYPGVQGCRSVEEFQCLNRIEEGTYGVVYRAKDKRTNEIVALKRLKMEKEKEGFPITSLREINTLLKGQHPNIVHVREIVVGSNMDKIFIVMDYVEHDLKSLMETMKQRKQNFLPSEVKCLIQQLLRAVAHLHDNWILHRDLKTSNLLLSHKGILKVGDFGLAREYGSPLKRYTLLVVTLWYRAPELLLCAPEYSTPIDMWSVGCIFAELLLMKPLFNGESEIDQINRIFKEMGTPDEVTWPGFKQLPGYKNILTQNSKFMDYKICNLKKRFAESVSELGIELLKGMLTFNPQKRLTAEAALRSPYFTELPLPIDPSMFPTWPAKSELGARKTAPSPKPPSGGGSRFPVNTNSVNTKPNTQGQPAGNARILSSIITGNKKTSANTGFVLNAGLEQRRLELLRSLNKK